MKHLIVQDDNGGLAPDTEAKAMAVYGARAAYGIQARYLPRSEILSSFQEFSSHSVVVADPHTTLKVLEKMNGYRPILNSFPSALARFFDRVPSLIQFGELENLLANPHFRPQYIFPDPSTLEFVHPFRLVSASDLAAYRVVPPQTRVWRVTAVDWVSLWRVYVMDGAWQGVTLLHGDPTAAPEESTLSKILTAVRNHAPSIMSFDVGVASCPSRPEDIRYPTLLHRTDSSMHFGHLGLGPFAYARMLNSAWQKLTAK